MSDKVAGNGHYQFHTGLENDIFPAEMMRATGRRCAVCGCLYSYGGEDGITPDFCDRRSLCWSASIAQDYEDEISSRERDAAKGDPWELPIRKRPVPLSPDCLQCLKVGHCTVPAGWDFVVIWNHKLRKLGREDREDRRMAFSNDGVLIASVESAHMAVALVHELWSDGVRGAEAFAHEYEPSRLSDRTTYHRRGYLIASAEMTKLAAKVVRANPNPVLPTLRRILGGW